MCTLGVYLLLHCIKLAWFCVADVSLEPGDEEDLTEGLFEGHQAAISAMQIHNGLLYTCSGDRTVRAFDLAVRLRLQAARYIVALHVSVLNSFISFVEP